MPLPAVVRIIDAELTGGVHDARDEPIKPPRAPTGADCARGQARPRGVPPERTARETSGEARR
jgi:hypothetical protein